MKTLWIARHAEAGHQTSDFLRTLTNRGRRQAQEMGAFIKAQKTELTQIICSDSVRTLETLSNWQLDEHTMKRTRIEPLLYLGEHRTLLKTLCKEDDHFPHLCLLAHNPGTSDLILHLAQQSHNLQPGELAEITLDVQSWREVSEGFGKLVRIFKPEQKPLT